MAAVASAAQGARKIVCTKLGTNFRACTQIQPVQIPQPLPPGTVTLQTTHVAINASDVNFTAGKYTPDVDPPFDVGFEAMGHVVEVAEDVTNVKPGDAVAVTQFGAFTELLLAKAQAVVPLPKCDPQLFPLFVSGLTASIALEQVGEMPQSGGGCTILVTAAAGATGQIAVQLAKAAGHTVIGTTSSDVKADHLRSLGVDRVVNYTKESLHEVLKAEYPKGLDIVYESVGGEMFDTSVRHLAKKGRLIVIGMISGYTDGSAFVTKSDDAGAASAAGTAPRTPWPVVLLGKSASVRGFFLNDFAAFWPEHMMRLWGKLREGTLKPGVDATAFSGLEAVPDAIDHLFARKNVGKVVVSVGSEESSSKL